MAKRMRVRSLSPALMQDISYDGTTGEFFYKSNVLKQWPTGRDGSLVAVKDFEILAHRLAFQAWGKDISGLVVFHIDGNKANNVADNLVAMPRGYLNRIRFWQRQVDRDRDNVRARVELEELLEPLS